MFSTKYEVPEEIFRDIAKYRNIVEPYNAYIKERRTIIIKSTNRNDVANLMNNNDRWYEKAFGGGISLEEVMDENFERLYNLVAFRRVIRKDEIYILKHKHSMVGEPEQKGNVFRIALSNEEMYKKAIEEKYLTEGSSDNENRGYYTEVSAPDTTTGTVIAKKCPSPCKL